VILSQTANTYILDNLWLIVSLPHTAYGHFSKRNRFKNHSCMILFYYIGIHARDVVWRTATEILLKTIVCNAFVVKCVVFSYRFSARIITNGVKVLVGRSQTVIKCAFNTVFLFTIHAPGRNVRSQFEIAVPCPTPLGARRVYNTTTWTEIKLKVNFIRTNVKK